MPFSPMPLVKKVKVRDIIILLRKFIWDTLINIVVCLGLDVGCNILQLFQQKHILPNTQDSLTM